MNDPLIRLDGLAKSWNGIHGVDNVDLSIARGEFVVLLGPSGCGKSTTLRMIAGLERPSAGRLYIGGKDCTDTPPSRRGLSMVFQSYALFPHLSVADNITFGLSVRGVARSARDSALTKAIALTGLYGLEQRKPSALSGGQRQRVALARAIVARHEICLMDEPLSNLDAKLRHAVRQEIKALQRELGMTVVYVTHDQTEAMGMADRILLMNEGRIEQAGPPAELYENPQTAFVATFVGSPPIALLSASRIAPQLLPPGAPADLENVDLGVRPEFIRLGEPGGHRKAAQVRDFEFLGAETLVYLSSGDAELIARVTGRASCQIGETVGLEWPANAALLFDRLTGARINGWPRSSNSSPNGQSHVTV